MAKDSFTFKQFEVRQDRCGMKVGTDGVLLGAWAVGGCRILDIGTGTGLIAMMMAQRFPEAKIDAIDIDHDACFQARENIAEAGFGDRVEVVETPLQQHSGEYDAIVSNPPFFENSLKAPEGKRSLARHTDSLPVSELLRCVSSLLSPQGVFSVVIPMDMLQRYEEEAVFSRLYIAKVCKIKTVERKPAKRCMVMIQKQRPEAIIVEEQVLQTANSERSEWYQQLTKDFYL